MNSENSTQYQSGAVRALVALHDREMRKFWRTWSKSIDLKVKMPPTDDPSCKTPNDMLNHVLHASRGYVRWICSQLKLNDPQLDRPSKSMNLLTESEEYLESLLAVWSTSLTSITEDQCYIEFNSRWKTIYCIDAMLEHAVMHPVRHSFQLDKYMRII
jgi:hypothetical protein